MAAMRHLIGVDEVGRGPLAGPLCVGAFSIVREQVPASFRKLRGLKDSKQLTHLEREQWFARISRICDGGSCAYATAFVSEGVIDRIGLALALSLAVGRAIRKLNHDPTTSFILLDGGLFAPVSYPFQETIIGGDEADLLIAAASIMAKVRRDRYMVRLAKRFPAYGFDSHKGYGTPRHYKALKEHGILPLHRMSFLSKFIERQKLALSSQLT